MDPDKKLVLIVDDEEDIRMFLSMVLEDAGFRVETAKSVDDALNKMNDEAPDCISLDMVMPGKSGIVLFHEVHKRKEWSHIPVIFVTGHAKDPKVKKDMDAASVLADSTLSGPTTYLDKPVTAEKYVRAIAKAMKVEIASSGREEDPAAMKSKLKNMLDDADPETLKKALELLKKQ